MKKAALLLALLVLVLAVPAHGQVIINEYNTGSPDFWELKNVGVAPVDISGWRVDTFYATTASEPVVDTTFTIPAGTILAPDGFAVGHDSSSGPTGPAMWYVGANLFWVAARNTEIILFDAGGLPIDYVYGDYFLYGPTARQTTTGSLWTGQYVPNGTDNGNYRTSNIDTDMASDWTSGASVTMGSNNPGQGAQPPISGLIINEFFTGTVPAVEIFNSTSGSIDLGGFELESWTEVGAGGGFIADPTFIVPAGTILASSDFIVLESGGVAGMPGTYPKSMSLGYILFWNGTMSIEIALSDNQGVFQQGVDYVFYDHFGTVAGAGPNLPAPTLWTGDFDTSVGDEHQRVSVSDTDSAADWAKNTSPHSLGTYNPPQVSGVQGILINEVSTGNPDWIELLNTTPNPVDVSGYVLNVYYTSGSGVPPQTGSPTLPSGSIIPAGGVMNFVESGTAGAPHATLPNTFHTGVSWPFVSSSNVEAILYGPLGVLPLDYVWAGVNENITPTGHLPGSLTWDGTLVSIGTANADIFERLTIDDRDNANDWQRDGLYTAYGSPGVLNPTQVAGCTAYYSQYGTGCVSSNGNPLMFGTGCPTPGGAVTIEFAFMPIGSFSMLAIGTGNASLFMTAGCDLQNNPIIPPQLYFTTAASTFSIAGTIPAAVPSGFKAYLQTLFADPANPQGVSSTNPLELVMN